MTGPEGAGVVILSVAGFRKLAGWGARWLQEYQLVRDCPHPEHRVYQTFSSHGDVEYLCDECGSLLEPHEEEDS